MLSIVFSYYAELVRPRPHSLLNHEAGFERIFGSCAANSSFTPHRPTLHFLLVAYITRFPRFQVAHISHALLVISADALQKIACSMRKPGQLSSIEDSEPLENVHHEGFEKMASAAPWPNETAHELVTRTQYFCAPTIIFRKISVHELCCRLASSTLPAS